MRRTLLIGTSLLFTMSACLLAVAQTQAPQGTDVLGPHSLVIGNPTKSGAQVTTPGSPGCTVCHAPHSGLGGVTPLWNQTLSNRTYTPYTSSTYSQTGNSQPTLGVTSSLCLSCHDGTVAVGQTAAYGQMQVNGSLGNSDVLGTNLAGSHPFSLKTPLKDAPDLAVGLATQGKLNTASSCGKAKLVNGSVECTSCHDPHVQGIDPIGQNYLLCNNSMGQLCIACHDPTRVVTGQANLLTGWYTSIHNTATNQVSLTANVGPYGTVNLNSCTSCHMEHNQSGYARLVRPAMPAITGVDPSTQDCITCHNGGTYLSPAAPNVYAGEFTKISHPLPNGSNTHDEAEPAVLSNNRHATCVDCHSPHGSAQMTAFTAPPGIRPPQSYAVGVSATDGATVVSPAVNQYETCFRCHGSSPGKQALIKYGYLPTRYVFSGDPLNLIPQFSPSATSSHPVVHQRTSPYPQPSLLQYMLNLNGTASSRSMIGASTQIFCTDCHASDDNREFGGTGPTGPHGSIYPHILERNYQFAQAVVPGGTVTNTYPSPSLSPQGPYALCAKCHDLNSVLRNDSWTQHNTHVSVEGFSCSVCHSAHGLGAGNPTITGERLINFDVGVVAPNQGMIAYNRSANTCTLVCHNAVHNPNGSVTVGGVALPLNTMAPRH